jgi:hypothetical protein
MESPHTSESFVDPHVEQAAAILTEKGYRIAALAGNAGRIDEKGVAEKQAMTFEHPQGSVVSKETWAALKSLGVRQYSGAIHAGQFAIEFTTGANDLETITEKWNQIAQILPTLE